LVFIFGGVVKRRLKVLLSNGTYGTITVQANPGSWSIGIEQSKVRAILKRNIKGLRAYIELLKESGVAVRPNPLSGRVPLRIGKRGCLTMPREYIVSWADARPAVSLSGQEDAWLTADRKHIEAIKQIQKRIDGHLTDLRKFLKQIPNAEVKGGRGLLRLVSKRG
jgi:hypothetical protein